MSDVVASDLIFPKPDISFGVGRDFAVAPALGGRRIARPMALAGANGWELRPRSPAGAGTVIDRFKFMGKLGGVEPPAARR